jgi:hypothetical protein
MTRHASLTREFLPEKATASDDEKIHPDTVPRCSELTDEELCSAESVT